MTHQRILIVDDDADFRESLGSVLRRRGYTVDLAASGSEALQLARAHEFGVAFIDVVMPSGDGVQCLDELLQVAPNVRVTLMTGFAVQERIETGLALGAAFVIHKPVDVPGLLRSVSTFCRGPVALVGLPEPDAHRLLKRELERHEINVVVAASPEQLLERLKQGGMDLIVLDLRLLGAAPGELLGEVAALVAGTPILVYNVGAGAGDSLAELLQARPTARMVGETDNGALLEAILSFWSARGPSQDPS